MFTGQAEYRRSLKGRFGLVAFGGLGGVAERWNAFRSDQLLPAAGASLRFTLERKTISTIELIGLSVALVTL